MSRFYTFLRQAARDEDGASTIPFIMFVPFFMMLTLSSVELGLIMVRHMMLERALDITVRDLRLGTWDSPDHDTIVSDICNNAGLIPDCDTALLVELVTVSTDTWALPSATATCVDRSAEIQPTTTFESGTSNDIMIVRACVKFDPIFPSSGLGADLALDSTGAYSLVSTTAFVNEPRT